MTSKAKAARLGLREVTVHFGTFDFEMICIAGPCTGVRDYVRWKHDLPDFEFNRGAGHGLFFFRRGYVPIIWIRRRPRTAREYGTLAHELIHVLQYMLVGWAGIHLNEDTDEVFAHAMGRAMTRILQELA